LLVVAYLARSGWHAKRGPANLGKHVVVTSTALIWFVGIVAVDQDFTFTVTNVTIHAIPYMALLWAYAKQRASERPGRLVARVVSWGWFAFITFLLLLAVSEEVLWERLVWHDRPGWFGGPVRSQSLLSAAARHLIVPLLSLPQVVHYVLDGVLWRSKDAGPAQARALGFGHARSS
jgi:membrane protease YdiL (CAAX protease family)